MPKSAEKLGDCETSQQRSALGRLIEMLASFFQSVVHHGAVQVTAQPQSPPPDKFNLGGDFHSWELQARRYIKKFPPEGQSDALLSLLSGQALTIALEDDLVSESVTDDTFARLRSALTPRTLAIDQARAFHERRQREGESTTTYLRQLRRLAEDGFPQDTTAEREKRLLDRLLEGMTDREVRKTFILNPPRSLSSAMEVATRCEDMARALNRDNPDKPYYHIALARGGPSSRRPAPLRRYRGRSIRSPQWPIPPRREDCPYCQRFGAAARTCGHNNPRPPRKFQEKSHVFCSSLAPAVGCPSSCTPALSRAYSPYTAQYRTADPKSAPIVKVWVNGQPLRGLLDTGANCSLLTRRQFTPDQPQAKWCIRSVNGTPFKTYGVKEVVLGFGGRAYSQSMVVIEDLPWDVILGVDALDKMGCVIDIPRREVRSNGRTIRCQVQEFMEYTLVAAVSEVSLEGQIDNLTQAVSVDAGRAALTTLIKQHKDSFAWDGTIGRTKVLQHQIHTGNAPPFRLPPRPIPLQYQEEVHKIIQQMLDQHVIRPSTSPWASPVVLVKKKDGSLRLCVDYRKLNRLTERDSYPLPRIEDLIEGLAGSKWFSTLDLASGYWQVEVDPVDRPKTAFVVPFGLYEFETMPFGLCNAPATFQRLMNTTLSDLTPHACLVYMDDVIVHGKTIEEHLQNLAKVFSRLQKVGLRLKPSKCNLLRREVGYLGHIISAEGVRTDPEKTRKIREWPTPINMDELRSFLGLASYYRSFIQGFANIARPLYKLLEKDVPFIWDNECSKAFQTLQQSLCSSPILAYPDTTTDAGPFILDTDASDSTIGAVLSQKDRNGIERVIAYGSRSLSRQERNYCTTRKEIWALVHFVKQYRHYLLGRPFIVRTDHQALQWLQNFKDPEGQTARWQEYLQEFTFECQHRPGKKHANADALSRRPARQHGLCPTCTDYQVAQVSLRFDDPVEWKHIQETDSETALLYARLRDGLDRPSAQEIAGTSWATRCLWACWQYLCVKQGVMYVQHAPSFPPKLVIPTSQVRSILTKLHTELGHSGVSKMFEAVHKRFWWPHQHRDVVNFCQSCELCARCKNPKHMHRAPLQPIQAGFPNEIVGVDLIGPLPETPRGNKYLLVMVDFFSKWCEAIPIKTMEATTVADAIIRHWICQWGAPNQIHSDQGASFDNTLMHELCRSLGIDKTRTTAYHPQGNSQVERTNRNLKELLKTFVHTRNDWDIQVPFCLMAYRASIHSSTQQTPSLLWTGREFRLPTDARLPTIQPERSTVNEYVTRLRETILHNEQLIL